MCRETVNSLSGYFAILSFLSGFISIPFIVNSAGNFVFLILGCISVGVAIAFVYLSAYLHILLLDSPKIVRAIILARIVLGIVMSLTPLISGPLPPLSVVRIIITIWVGWYLIKQCHLVSLKLKLQQRSHAGVRH